MIYLFDLDGTILDSTAPIRRSMEVALAGFGLIPLSDDELRAQIGPPLRTSLANLLARRGASAQLVEPLVEAYRADYVVSSIELAATFPGIPAVLQQIGAAHRMGVVTSKPRRFAVPILEHLGLARLMEVIEGPRRSESETKQMTLARTLEVLGVEGGDTIMIGDRHHDIDAGKAVGSLTIGVTWGYAGPGELEAAGPDLIIVEAEQIPQGGWP